MSIFIAIIGAIFAIFSIIILHELGHYFVARMFGIKILKFSIGFGKAIWKRVSKKTGTEYALAILPLGGYVKMLGEGEQATSPAEAHQAFNRKPLLVRMAVVLAGPVTNLLIAAIAYWGVFLMGVTHVKPVIGRVVPNSIAAQAGIKQGDQLIKVDNVLTPTWQRVMMAVIMRMGDSGQMSFTVKPANSQQVMQKSLSLANWHVERRSPNFFKSLGIYPYSPKVPPIVEATVANSAAAKAGLRAGDRIVAFNGMPVKDWFQLVKEIRAFAGKRVMLTVKRDSQLRQLPVIVGSRRVNNKITGYLGVEVKSPVWPKSMAQKKHYTVLTAWLPAIDQTWTLLRFNFMVMVKMIAGKISVHTLGGPITVFHAAGKASQAGWKVYLSFIGFISLTVGFLNLLPIPGLDGGHLLFQLIEAIFRRPVPERYQMIGLTLGMVFLVFLMVQATINDLLRLF